VFIHLLPVSAVALAPTVAVVTGFLLNRMHMRGQDKELREIHIDVNSRMDDALKKIASLELTVARLLADKRQLQGEVNDAVDKLG
jgi:hypothetical protein